MISSLPDIVNHPNVALSVMRSRIAVIAMIAVVVLSALVLAIGFVLVIVLVVTHLGFSSLL